jgi:hypothetical protein
MTAVRGDNHSSLDVSQGTAVPGDEESVNCTTRGRSPLNESVLFDRGTGLGSGSDQHPIEILAQDRSTAGPRRISSLDTHAAVAGDQHALYRKVSGDTSDSQSVEQRERTGIDRVSAKLVTREPRAIEDLHTSASARQHDGCYGARWAAAGNYNIGGLRPPHPPTRSLAPFDQLRAGPPHPRVCLR